MDRHVAALLAETKRLMCAILPIRSLRARASGRSNPRALGHSNAPLDRHVAALLAETKWPMSAYLGPYEP